MPAAVPGTVVQVGAGLGPGGDTGLTGASGAAGSAGPAGAPGAAGAAGTPAYTTTSAQFTVPPVGQTINVTLTNASWVTIGQMLAIQNAGGTTAGTLQVTGKTGNQVTLLNPSIPSIALASPSGPGLLGTLSGNVTDYVGGDNGCHPLPPLPASVFYGADTTNNQNYAVTVSAQFALIPGATVYVTPSTANLANPTLNVNGTGAISVVNRANVALNARELAANKTFGVTYDGTSWRVITRLARVVSQTTSAGGLTVECAGFDSIRVYWSTATSAGLGLTLSHLAEGVPILLDLANSFSSAVAWWINMTTPEGNTGVSYWVWTNALTGGAVTRIDSGGGALTLTAGFHFFVWGENVNGSFLCK